LRLLGLMSSERGHRKGPAPSTSAGGQNPHKRRASRSLRKAVAGLPRAALWTLGVLAGLIVLLLIASFFVDEPMRRSMERRMNQSLTGYTVRLPRLHFRLLGLSVTLYDLTVSQQANPDPPVAVIPKLHASVQWRELFTGHIVSDFLFDKPRIRVNLPQLRKEASDATPIKDRGWQQAAKAIYPFKINLLRVDDGDFVYIDEDPQRPLHIAHLSLRASNIRNIHSKDRIYPSPVHAEGVLFETGRGVMDGHADFLSEPFAGVHVIYKVEKVPLDNFRPISARSNLVLKGGELDSQGEVEYAPKAKLVHVTDLSVAGLHLDYLHTLPTAAAENARKEEIKAAAKDAGNQGVVLKLDKLDVVRSNLGLVNKAKNPPYRMFFSDSNVHVTNLSNRYSQGPAVARLRGKFMGSGPAVAHFYYRPNKSGADFDLDLAIEDTQLTAMNDILRAYGKFDVTAGTFSFYSQLRVKNGQMNGYVKPLLAGMKVYDPEQDKQKSIFHKLYEMLVGGIANLLENKRTNDVATQAEISGPVGSAKASAWQIIGSAFENAFIKAILPGFEKQIERLRAKR
jgi:hypothetical protein